MRLGMTFAVESSLGGLSLLRLELQSPRDFIRTGNRAGQRQARATGPLDGHAIPRNSCGGGGLTYCHHWSQAVVLTPSGLRMAVAREPASRLPRSFASPGHPRHSSAGCRGPWRSVGPSGRRRRAWWTWAMTAVSSCFLGIFRNAAPIDRSGSRADAPLRRPAFSLGPCASRARGRLEGGIRPAAWRCVPC